MADIVYDTASLPDAYVGVAYAVKLATHGAATPLTASSITVGALPTGLALSTGATLDEITGTPTVPGTYSFTVSLTDTAGAVTKAMTCNVWGLDQLPTKDTELPNEVSTEKSVVQSEWPVVQ